MPSFSLMLLSSSSSSAGGAVVQVGDVIISSVESNNENLYAIDISTCAFPG